MAFLSPLLHASISSSASSKSTSLLHNRSDLQNLRFFKKRNADTNQATNYLFYLFTSTIPQSLPIAWKAGVISGNL
jgi:hypothetical protein